MRGGVAVLRLALRVLHIRRVRVRVMHRVHLLVQIVRIAEEAVAEMHVLEEVHLCKIYLSIFNHVTGR